MTSENEHPGISATAEPVHTSEGRAALAEFPLFMGASAATLDVILRHANLRRCVADEEILSRDEQAGEVYFVLKGEVRIVNYSASGREVAYAIIPAGGYFGELSAIDGAPRAANVTAVSRSRLCIIPARTFLDFIFANPVACHGLLITCIDALAFSSCGGSASRQSAARAGPT